VLTITVAPALSSASVPTGTVAIKVDGTTVTTLTLTNGSATYNFSSATSGSHIVSATYSGSTAFAASNGSLAVVVTSIGSFTISAPALSIAAGANATETITLTPAGGYTGSVGFTVSTSSSITDTCYALGAANVTNSNPVQTSLTIYTDANTCSGYTPLSRKSGKVASLDHRNAPALPRPSAPVGISLAGLVAVGILGRRSKRLRGLVLMAMLGVAGFGLSGCGDSSSTGSTTLSANAPTGTYTVTVTATDAYTPTITASTTFTLTIH
jgi:hypothetical protein